MEDMIQIQDAQTRQSGMGGDSKNLGGSSRESHRKLLSEVVAEDVSSTTISVSAEVSAGMLLTVACPMQ